MWWREFALAALIVIALVVWVWLMHLTGGAEMDLP